MHPALVETSHRPWPLPRRPWALAMSWHDLAFLHWPVSPNALRALLPPALTLDMFDGVAWLGVVPFWMSGVRPRWTPPLPGLATFAELNVRTYVVAGDKPGVWFFSLDAASSIAVRGARALFHLPYFDARMSVSREGGATRYRSERSHRGAPEAVFAGRYRGLGPARGDSLERWLTERYCLYAANREGRLFRGEIHHRSWPLHEGEAEIEHLDVTRLLGVELSGPPPLVHFSERLDVIAWLLAPVEAFTEAKEGQPVSASATSTV
jgi:uncharacterized protein